MPWGAADTAAAAASISSGSVIVGGFWAWLHFVRSGPFRTRANLSVETAVDEDQVATVSVAATALGKAKLELQKEDLAPTVTIYRVTPELLESPPTDWSPDEIEPTVAFEVMGGEDTIEAGETLTDVQIVSLGEWTDDTVAYRTEFYLTTNWPWHFGNSSWRAVLIATRRQSVYEVVTHCL